MKYNSAAPEGHPLFGHLPALRDDPLGFLSQCARDYDRTVPLRFPLVRAFLILDAADIEHILVAEHRNFVKPIWLRTAAVRRLLGDGLVTSDGEEWRQQRRECHHAFLPGLIPDYSATFSDLTGRMLVGWGHGQERDIQRDMTRLTLQIVSQTMLGRYIDGEADEISGAMDAIMECFSARYRLFGLLPLPPSRRERAAVDRLDRVVDRMVQAGGDKEPSGGNGQLLRSLKESCREGMTLKALREQVKTFLAAGHESSALALTWAFMLLAMHPEYDARLAHEAQTVLNGRLPAFDDLQNLPFTQAVVKETLRLYPPLWITGRRAISQCEIGGRKIPAGSLLITSQWAVQRSPRYFDDPDSFRPERWAALADLPRFAYFPFGGGPRICIGQNFAAVETALILASIACKFRLELAGEQSLAPWATMTLRPPWGLKMRLVAR